MNLKENEFDDEYIESLTKQFNLKCHISCNVIFVWSEYAKWKIYHNNKKVTSVYHESYRNKYQQHRSKIKNKKWNVGYHQQYGLENKSLYKIFQYIRRHDDNYIKRNNSNLRINKLFDKISKNNN